MWLLNKNNFFCLCFILASTSLLGGYSFANPPSSRHEKLSKQHINAVGLAVIRLDSHYVDRGTATLIEPDIAVSAAHVFRSVFPQGPIPQRSGPLHIDLRERGAFIYFLDENGRGGVQKVKILSLVVEARFVNSIAKCHEGRLSREAQAHDVVFLELESVSQGLPSPVPLYKNEKGISKMCASYGYGVSSKQEVPIRQGIIYCLDLPKFGLGQQVIRLNNKQNMPQGDYNRAISEVSYLTGEPGFAPHEAYVGQARPGDSGGPLFAITSKGIRVIGVMSVYGKQKWDDRVDYYNGFCSLIEGNKPKGYFTSGLVHELLGYLKKNMLGRRG